MSLLKFLNGPTPPSSVIEDRLKLLACSGTCDEISAYLKHNHVNTVDEQGCTLLMYAVLFRRLDIAVFLINMNANINIANNKGETALMWAVDPSLYKVDLNLLKSLTAFVHINHKNKAGETALSFIIRYNNNPKLRSNFNEATRLAIVKYLIDKGFYEKPDLDLVSNGETPLISALSNRRYDIAKVLIENGADCCGTQALQIAIAHGNIELGKLLIDNGADYYSSDQQHVTAYQFAKNRSLYEITNHIDNKNVSTHFSEPWMCDYVKYWLKDFPVGTCYIYLVCWDTTAQKIHYIRPFDNGVGFNNWLGYTRYLYSNEGVNLLNTIIREELPPIPESTMVHAFLRLLNYNGHDGRRFYFTRSGDTGLFDWLNELTG